MTQFENAMNDGAKLHRDVQHAIDGEEGGPGAAGVLIICENDEDTEGANGGEGGWGGARGGTSRHCVLKR